MKKAIVILAACAILALGIPALAADSGAYSGSVVATESVNVLAPCDGTLADFDLSLGGTVQEGDVAATYETQKVYATGDGAVTAVWAQAGEDPDGDAVLEVEPIHKYTIYATTEGAYTSEDTLMAHAGENVYIKCTTDGTHRGTGEITQIDGTDYTVVTTGGEFFVGETVYLYRDADFSSDQKIGIGTLIYSDNVKYDSEGTVIALHVREGDRVERGQLLYEVLGTGSADITAPASGIVASVFTDEGDSTDETATADTATAATAEVASSASYGADTAATGGNSVTKGDVIAVIYPYDALMIQISVSVADLKNLSVGEMVSVLFADDEEMAYTGVIEKISNVAEDGTYAVLLSVDRDELFIGMTCNVFTQ